VVKVTWEEPERFDVTRNLTELRKHFAFGVGIHYCLGAPLARMAAQLALGAVLAPCRTCASRANPRV
jgi:cytochrome P450